MEEAENLYEKVRLARRVAFSSGHRYWVSSWTDEENRSAFGRWASPYNHGHNYVLEVAFEGAVDPVTGMVVNIKRISDLLEDCVVAAFDQKSINDEVPAFRDRPPTLENLLLHFASELGGLPVDAQLVSLRLDESPLLYGEWRAGRAPASIMTLTRVYEFAASHRLHCPALTPEENVATFGKCNNPHGHGHNYVLEVTVSGEPDPRTGMLVDLEALDRAVEERVLARYDHRNLSVELEEFSGRNATSEVVAIEIHRLLDCALPAKLERIRLYETARSCFEVSR